MRLAGRIEGASLIDLLDEMFPGSDSATSLFGAESDELSTLQRATHRCERPDFDLVEAMTFNAGDELSFKVFHQGEYVKTLELTVERDAHGTYNFASEKGKLNFAVRDNSFYCNKVTGSDNILRKMSMAISSLPLSSYNRKQWSDTLSIRGMAVTSKKWLSRLTSHFRLSKQQIQIHTKWVNQYTTQGLLTSSASQIPIMTQTNFNTDFGLFIIHVGKWKFIRQ